MAETAQTFSSGAIHMRHKLFVSVLAVMPRTDSYRMSSQIALKEHADM